jgi:hypothetical protein
MSLQYSDKQVILLQYNYCDITDQIQAMAASSQAVTFYTFTVIFLHFIKCHTTSAPETPPLSWAG